jgi:peptidyl-prolyl cis-trans isomerase C
MPGLEVPVPVQDFSCVRGYYGLISVLQVEPSGGFTLMPCNMLKSRVTLSATLTIAALFLVSTVLAGCVVQSKHKVRSFMNEEELAEIDAIYNPPVDEDDMENGDAPAREVEPFLVGVEGPAIRLNGMDIPADPIRELYEYYASFRDDDFIVLKQEACREILQTYSSMSQWPESVQPALARMAEIKAQAESGVPFLNLVVENSQEPGAQEGGGDLGRITRGMMVAPFEAVVFTAPIGEVYGPFPTIFGWHLIEIRSRDDSDPDNPSAEARHLLLFHGLDPENGREITENLGRWSNLADVEIVAEELYEVLPWLVEPEGNPVEQPAE